MARVRIDGRPFFLNKGTGVELFRGVSDERNVPIVLKRYDCTHIELADSVSEMNQRLSEGLVQTRVDHPNSCKLLDMFVDITPDFKISVSHVLEALDKDVNQAIEERKKAHQQYTEAELLTFLFHTAQALAHAHSKGIAHRDIKPANIFQTAAGQYKVGDFGAFWEKKRLWDEEMRSYTESGMGTPVFMGPQMKQVCMGLGGQYHAFKNDVYALGASALNLAALSPPIYLKELQRLDEVVAQKVAQLDFSDQLATLLRDMLSMAEDCRPTMEVVLQRLSSPVMIATAVQHEEVKAPAWMKAKKLTAPLPAPTKVKTTPSAIVSRQLALLTQNEVRLFNFQSLSWGAPVALAKPIQCDKGSCYTVIESDSLLCCGGEEGSEYLSSAYLVKVRADQCPVTQLPNMNYPRSYLGVIHCEGATYVFGSWVRSEGRATGEMLTFPPTAWTPLPGHMNEPRCCFSPCVYQRNIYLCGWGTTMELFSLLARCFQPLEVQLPEEKSPCVLWVDGEDVTVISQHYSMRVGSAPTKHENKYFYVNSSAVVYEDSVYWVSKWWNECVRAGKAGLESYKA